jgi:hypothetical protein
VFPQNQYCDVWAPAVEWWYGEGKTQRRRCGSGYTEVPAVGRKVRKLIGYDNSPNDRKRYAQAVGVEDPKYDYWYPLLEWHWDRAKCKDVIRAEGLPVPPKSACYFCPATQPEELHEHRKVYLRFIIIMEARAEPRLEEIKGLWRNGIKGTKTGRPRPGKMTDYIREHKLLPADEIDHLVETAPKELLDNQVAFANGLEIPEWHDFIEMFTPEDAADEIACGHHRVPQMSLVQLGTDRAKLGAA